MRKASEAGSERCEPRNGKAANGVAAARNYARLVPGPDARPGPVPEPGCGPKYAQAGPGPKRPVVPKRWPQAARAGKPAPKWPKPGLSAGQSRWPARPGPPDARASASINEPEPGMRMM